jgi:hypothetical protein
MTTILATAHPARTLGRFAAILLAVATVARADDLEPEAGRLRAHVATLASPAFEGRRGEGGRRAARYVEDALRALKLDPLFDGGFVQDIPGREPGVVLGRNVGARLPGADPALRDEWIILAAHFDHLGVRNGVLYPGADDNATAVAMMLESARCLARSAERPRRGILFIGFDLEEDGLFGSRYFVEHMPVPLEKVALFVTADMLGRSLGGVCRNQVFVMGAEHAPGLRPWVARASEGKGLGVGMLGSDVLLLDRSDYGPFRIRRVPYLFFSTGENPCYHRPTDTADTVDYSQVEAISRIILDVVRRTANADSVPRWSSEPDHSIDEAVAVRGVLRTLLEHRDELKIKPVVATLMANTLRSLDPIIARGRATTAERSRYVRVAQVVLFSVF